MEENTELKIQVEKEEVDPKQITFHIQENNENVELLRLSKDGFYYRGEKVDDIHDVYERFNEWLTMAYERRK